MPSAAPQPVFFPSPAELHSWLQANHDQAQEVWIGFYKKSSEHSGITYKEALDEALCFGWIDGVRKSLDEARWCIRFTPRKPGSIWSQVNLKRAAELKERGLLQAAGLRELDQRDPRMQQRYSYENRPQQLEPADEATFRTHPEAWKFFAAQPPSYRRTASWWVLSAKKEETRAKRLKLLIEASGEGKRLPQVAGQKSAKSA